MGLGAAGVKPSLEAAEPLSAALGVPGFVAKMHLVHQGRGQWSRECSGLQCSVLGSAAAHLELERNLGAEMPQGVG